MKMNDDFSRLETLVSRWAVEIGLHANGIAFQITSRTGADKIRSDLHTFKDKNLLALYPQGIRFLMLVDQKVAYCLFALPFTNHPKNGNLYCFTVSLFSVKIKLRKLK